MHSTIIKKIFSAVFLSALLMSGCNSMTPDQVANISIGGTVTGLTGAVVLQNNGGDDLTILANGSFGFVTPIHDGSPYNVTVNTQPIGQTCLVSNGTGTVQGSSDHSHVAVACSDNSYTVGGTISGLTGTVVLQDNNGDDLTLAANGVFTFATPVQNSPYNVTVLTQPAEQTCSVSAGAGTVSGANVANVVVVCSTNSYTVGGTVSGLTGTVVLRDNNADDLTLASNGVFTFATQVADSSPFSVTVLTQPIGRSCSVASGTGLIAAANVTTVAITCAINNFTIGGTVSGMTGNVHLQNNNSDDLNVFSNGTFTFATAVAYGNPYSVTVWSLSNADQTYTITNGSGAATANVHDVTINVVPCAAGLSNCDMDNLNGCEIDTQTELLNCGSCGISCISTWSCVAGVCTPPPCTMDADCPGPGATCSSGVCIAGCSVASECAGSDTACQTRTCSVGICGFSNTAAGTSCDDSSACTTGDVCNGSGTCAGWPSVTCDDSNACTVDACDAGLGCTHAPFTGGACDDGNVCTVSDSCSAGVCVGSNVANGSSCGGGSSCQSGVCAIPCVSNADCAFGQCYGGMCQP
jgi:hypothetical protein